MDHFLWVIGIFIISVSGIDLPVHSATAVIIDPPWICAIIGLFAVPGKEEESEEK